MCVTTARIKHESFQLQPDLTFNKHQPRLYYRGQLNSAAIVLAMPDGKWGEADTPVCLCIHASGELGEGWLRPRQSPALPKVTHSSEGNGERVCEEERGEQAPWEAVLGTEQQWEPEPGT